MSEGPSLPPEIAARVAAIKAARDPAEGQQAKRQRYRVLGVGPGEITTAEQRVLDALCRGATTKEAAAELFLSIDTIKEHLKNMLRCARSRTELAYLYGRGDLTVIEVTPGSHRRRVVEQPRDDSDRGR